VATEKSNPRNLATANRDAGKPRHEPFLAQIASFVDLFVWLLVLKSFFLPLFIIPTGSMAETLRGAHATHACPNCGYEYEIGFQSDKGPDFIECPNCRFQEATQRVQAGGVQLLKKSGDRIVVHGWPYEFGGRFGPQRWDVVVFKNPNKPRNLAHPGVYQPTQPHDNYIKRLIGLPGETIELIDGDVFVKKPGEDHLHVARKTRYAQQALWFPYYDHDYLPRNPSTPKQTISRTQWTHYAPRWAELGSTHHWDALDTRAPSFAGLTRPGRAEIQFVTGPPGDTSPGRIEDVYGYNSFGRERNDEVLTPVTDIRLSASVLFDDGDGYLELAISKYDDVFVVRLHRDGTLTVDRIGKDNATASRLAELEIGRIEPNARLSIGQADYQVVVELDGRVVFASTAAQYDGSAEVARRNADRRITPMARIAAENVRLSLSHIRIDRDVHYTGSDRQSAFMMKRRGGGNGVIDSPITLDNAYFCMGDNSPNSADGRLWNRNELGPSLEADFANGKYKVGTVPAKDMIGRAFLVYWPGFQPILPELKLRERPRLMNLLPDVGRVRWIH